MYNFELGTAILLIILTITVYACRTLARYSIDENIHRIDTLLFLGLILRIIWAVIVIFLQSKMSFFVYDDEVYYKYALQGLESNSVENGYYVFLSWLYDNFGRTSLNGRIVNAVVGLMTIYPIACIERNLNKNTSFFASSFFAISPFIIFISFFEIKDIILLFCFTASYALIKEYVATKQERLFLLILPLCLISEQIRTGMGVIPITILIISIILKNMGNSRRNKIFSIIFIFAAAISAGSYIGQEYINNAVLKIDKYQNWILTQFSGQSIYNSFVITKISDIWKLPFCFVLYALQPLNALNGTDRFFFEYGMFAKMIDIPILLMSMWWLAKYVKVDKLYSLLFLLPYAFVSGVNLTNARQGFFLYPIMYIICFYGYEMTGNYIGKNRILLFFNRKKILHLIFVGLYAIWTLFVIIYV